MCVLLKAWVEALPISQTSVLSQYLEYRSKALGFSTQMCQEVFASYGLFIRLPLLHPITSTLGMSTPGLILRSTDVRWLSLDPVCSTDFHVLSCLLVFVFDLISTFTQWCRLFSTSCPLLLSSWGAQNMMLALAVTHIVDIAQVLLCTCAVCVAKIHFENTSLTPDGVDALKHKHSLQPKLFMFNHSSIFYHSTFYRI